jgi:hypothetical protein
VFAYANPGSRRKLYLYKSRFHCSLCSFYVPPVEWLDQSVDRRARRLPEVPFPFNQCKLYDVFLKCSVIHREDESDVVADAKRGAPANMVTSNATGTDESDIDEASVSGRRRRIRTRVVPCINTVPNSFSSCSCFCPLSEVCPILPHV